MSNRKSDLWRRLCEAGPIPEACYVHPAGLRRLKLEGSVELCDETLLKLAALHGLTHLDISECPSLAPSAVSALRRRMPSSCAIFSATS